MAFLDFLSNKESMQVVGQQASGIAVILISTIVFVLIIGIVIFLYMQQRRYKQFRCIIWERDAFGHMHQNYDDAGIFTDSKTNNKRLFLKKYNVGLATDDIPYIQGGKIKYIFLLKTGLKNFSFIKPNFDTTFENLNLEVTEEDVNWGINAYEKQKKLFANSLLMQLLPFMLLAFVSVVILIIFVYFFRNFGVLKEVALAFKDASQNLACGGTQQILTP